MNKMLLQIILFCCQCMAPCSDTEETGLTLPPDRGQEEPETPDRPQDYTGLVNGTALAADYRPDALDEVSADVCTVGMIYAFYGRLSVASTDVDKFRAAEIPPTFFAYGTRDPFYRQFQQCADAVREAGVEVEQHEYEGLPHGFGYTHEAWMVSFDRWMTEIMANN